MTWHRLTGLHPSFSLMLHIPRCNNVTPRSDRDKGGDKQCSHMPCHNIRKQAARDHFVWTLLLRRDAHPPPRGSIPPPHTETNWTWHWLKKSSVHPLKASYLPRLVRGKFLSGSLGVWLRRDGFVAVRCCLAVPSCSPAPSLSCARHRLLFRDVLIKQHVEPESRTAAVTRTVPPCSGGETFASQTTWQPWRALLKIDKWLVLWRCRHGALLREWPFTSWAVIIIFIVHGNEMKF